MVIDLFGLGADEVRSGFLRCTNIYLQALKQREGEVAKSKTTDAQAYLETWWQFGKPRHELRPALEGLPRFIATVDTAKHRIFNFSTACAGG